MSEERAEALHYYDQLADEYDLLYADWQNTVRYEGEVLDALIREVLGDEPRRSVLDCSCGIGTQVLGLAGQGYRMHASDVSGESVERARNEAKKLGLDVEFSVTDMRNLGSIGGAFDVVLSCDNALPHFLSDDELATAIRSMRERLRPGGLFLASIRDYDRALREKLRWMNPHVYDDPDGLRIVFQVWDWQPDGRTYRVHQFIVRQRGEEWPTRHSDGLYRALRRDELESVLRNEGLSEIRWRSPEETGYPQPIVTART